LVFLESFNCPAAVLKIGKYETTIPLDWNLIVCDPAGGDPEVLPITALNDRGFKAFVFNPLAGFVPDFIEIEITNIYQEVKWYFPKLVNGHILAVPIEDTDKPKCVYFVKELSKIPPVLDMGDLW